MPQFVCTVDGVCSDGSESLISGRFGAMQNECNSCDASDGRRPVRAQAHMASIVEDLFQELIEGYHDP